MAYNQTEISVDSGQPIYLYEFKLNDNYWRYASCEDHITLDGQLWSAIGIFDNGIRQSGEAQSDSLNVDLPQSAIVVDLFRGTPPINSVYLTIRKFHRGDTEAAVCYVGEVMQADIANPAKAVLTANTLSATFERNGLRLTWSRTCPFALYDDATCRVNTADFRVEAKIESVGDGTITAPQLARFGERYFAGGYIEWVDKLRGTERRAITSHDRDTIEIFGTVGGLTGGLIFYAFPGCNRTKEQCRQKFNNIDNFGGFPYMPGRSPFDGNPIY